jgi:gas vesicle protein
MGQDPEALRRDIEHTRERMGDTVEAIGYRADVPGRAKEKVGNTLTDVRERIVGTADGVKDRVAGATDSVNQSTPSTHDVKQAARRGASIAQENPLGLALGSVAVGFLAGMLIPGTQVENEKIGPMADQVKDQIKDTGQEALDRGRQVAQEVASTAQQSAQQVAGEVKETAQQAAQEHGEQMKQSAQQSAQQVRSS